MLCGKPEGLVNIIMHLLFIAFGSCCFAVSIVFLLLYPCCSQTPVLFFLQMFLITISVTSCFVANTADFTVEVRLFVSGKQLSPDLPDKH